VRSQLARSQRLQLASTFSPLACQHTCRAGARGKIPRSRMSSTWNAHEILGRRRDLALHLLRLGNLLVVFVVFAFR
jgi:hypothetical protein